MSLINGFRTFLRTEDIEPANRVFINRNLKLDSITHMGFDMDHTLAVYSDEAQELAFDLAKEKLVSSFGYPAGVGQIKYTYGAVIRGLIIDKKKGNLIKLDHHKYVELACHGTRKLNKDERKRTYNLPGERYRPDSDDYSYLDTLFCLPEAYLFASVVDYMDEYEPGTKDYRKMHQQVREAIDTVHKDGSLKARIIAELPRYIIRDPLLPKTLLHFIQGQKRLFLLTNSEYYYTNVVMSYLLNGENPRYSNWQDYFQFIVVSAKKPGFFLKEAPLNPVTKDEMGNELDEKIARKVFNGGYFKAMEQELGSGGESTLYFGDHTFGDILKSKQKCGWRTVMIIKELEEEISILQAQKKDKEDLEKLRRKLQEKEDDTHMLEHQITYLRSRKLENYEDLSEEELSELDRELAGFVEILSRNETKMTGYLKEIKALEERLNNSYNQNWGCLFKSSHRKSRLGDQVEDFACLYTAKVTNFSYYPTTKYFRIKADLMAHERHE